MRLFSHAFDRKCIDTTWEVFMVLCFGLTVRFEQIKMVDEDVHKIIIITKTRFFEWNVMPFTLKNGTNTFFRTMLEVFK